MAEDAVLRGGCECGAVEYEVADAFEYALTCHCSTCRASTGSMFKPFGGIAREQLRVVKGGDTLLVWGEADGNHTRCGVCGALLFSVVGPRVHVTYGSLRDEPTLKPAAHIFVGSKAPWEEIIDDLPQHDEYLIVGPAPARRQG
jgi:hypothetical protein